MSSLLQYKRVNNNSFLKECWVQNIQGKGGYHTQYKISVNSFFFNDLKEEFFIERKAESFLGIGTSCKLRNNLVTVKRTGSLRDFTHELKSSET